MKNNAAPSPAAWRAEGEVWFQSSDVDMAESLSGRTPEDLDSFVRSCVTTVVSDLWRHDAPLGEEAVAGRLERVVFKVNGPSMIAACRRVAESLPVEAGVEVQELADSDVLEVRAAGVSPHTSGQIEGLLVRWCPPDADVDVEVYNDFRGGTSIAVALEACRSGWGSSEGSPVREGVAHDFLKAALDLWRSRFPGPLKPMVQLTPAVRRVLGGGDVEHYYDAYFVVSERMTSRGDLVIGLVDEAMAFYFPPSDLTPAQLDMYLTLLRDDGVPHQRAEELAALTIGSPPSSEAASLVPADTESIPSGTAASAHRPLPHPEMEPDRMTSESHDDVPSTADGGWSAPPAPLSWDGTPLPTPVPLRWVPALSPEELQERASTQVLDPVTRALVASYMAGGTTVLEVTMVAAEAGAGLHTVPAGTATDGEFLWNRASAYYAEHHGISPDDDLVEKAVAANGVCPHIPSGLRSELGLNRPRHIGQHLPQVPYQLDVLSGATTTGTPAPVESDPAPVAPHWCGTPLLAPAPPRWVGVPSPDELRTLALGQTMDWDTRMLVVSYLTGGQGLLAALMRTEDAVTGRNTVPTGFSTDGEFIWGWDAAYYAEEYGIAPDRALVEKAVAANGECPAVSPGRLAELLQALAPHPTATGHDPFRPAGSTGTGSDDSAPDGELDTLWDASGSSPLGGPDTPPGETDLDELFR